MIKYTQLKEFERVQIYEGIKMGLSDRTIAKKIGRHHSTVSREVKRNSDSIGYLYPRDAQKRTEERKARHGCKINRRPYSVLKNYVIEKLNLGWSPVVTAGRWNRGKSKKNRISPETIYSYAYRKENRELKLWKLLPKAKKRRGQKRKTRPPEGTLPFVSIHDRPQEINARKTIGHYEADLMFNSGSQSANVLTIIERKSRMIALVKNRSKHSEPVAKALKQRLGSSAKSCTFDRGKEFVLHHELGIQTFFCDPGSPWQKGSVENANGLLRRYFPFSLSHQFVTQEQLDTVAFKLNNTPRKILGFLTPFEVFMRDSKKERESRMKTALPAAEVLFYQKNQSVALRA